MDGERVEREADAGYQGHFVIYAHGTVYNPASGQWWMDLDSYLRYTHYQVCGIFVRVS